jgi:hypothetical protein
MRYSVFARPRLFAKLLLGRNMIEMVGTDLGPCGRYSSIYRIFPFGTTDESRVPWPGRLRWGRAMATLIMRGSLDPGSKVKANVRTTGNYHNRSKVTMGKTGDTMRKTRRLL